MILVDTSVWVDHLRNNDEQLGGLLMQGLVSIHPMIIGELACGNLQNRKPLLGLLHTLPTLPEASHQETLFLLESYQLMGKGIGYIDLHLLAACLLAGNARLWTRDKRLAGIAVTLGVAFTHH